MAESRWFAVRTVVYDKENKPWGPHDLKAGESSYEERITIWRCSSVEEAFQCAKNESTEYAESLGVSLSDLFQIYALDDQPSFGAEVFSLVRKSSLPPDIYISKYFADGSEYQSFF